MQCYRPLAAYEAQSQLETIFGVAAVDLLAGWNAASTFEQAVHPQRLLAEWLGRRLEPGGKIERFLEEVCGVEADTAGLLVGGEVLPNPLAFVESGSLSRNFAFLLAINFQTRS